MLDTGFPRADVENEFLRARRRQFLAMLADRVRGGRGARRDFDRRFRPTSARVRSRWEQLALAQRRGAAMLPIEVYRVVIDCTDPELLARFWAAALGYALEPPPEGFATWDDWRRDIGLPDSGRGIGADSIIDPRGEGPRIWFRVEPDPKVVKNRLHLDIHVSGGRGPGQNRSVPLATRTQLVDAEARRLAVFGPRSPEP